MPCLPQRLYRNTKKDEMQFISLKLNPKKNVKETNKTNLMTSYSLKTKDMPMASWSINDHSR